MLTTGHLIHDGSKSHSISFADEVEGDSGSLENVFIVESFKVSSGVLVKTGPTAISTRSAHFRAVSSRNSIFYQAYYTEDEFHSGKRHRGCFSLRGIF